MFIPTSSVALVQTLDRSAPRLFDDYRHAYAKNDPTIPVLLDPDRFDHVVREMIVLIRPDEKPRTPSPRPIGMPRSLEVATQAILRLISRWERALSADAAAWELAVATAHIRATNG